MSVPKPQKPLVNDHCQTSPLCSCTEKTKRWADALPFPVPGEDNYLQIGGTKFDPTKDLFTVGNYNQNITTLWLGPKFQAGSANPAKLTLFKKQIFHLVEAFLKVNTGQYPCVPHGYKPNPTIYISGPISCRGSDQNRLLEKRVVKVAQGIRDQLEASREKLTQSVAIKYGKDAFSCTDVAKGKNHINVLIAGDSMPGDWKLFRTVSPKPK